MSTTILPYLLIDLLPYSTILLGSSTQALIASIDTGEVLYSVNYERSMEAPRFSAVLPLRATEGDQSGGSHSGSSSKQIDSPVECLLALVGDDKDLHIFRIGGLSTKTVTVEETWSLALPKRLVKMVWEQDDNTAEKILTTGDRHGDIRTFTIPITKTERNERDTKRRRIAAPDEDKKKEEGDDVDDGDDIDSTNPPLLGHVSMLTDFVLTSFTSPSPQMPEGYIISSDRDEHIRISRWGKRRAGHLALRYLLGSTDAVGALFVIEHDLLDVLRKGVATTAAEDICKSPLLLSTDSSILRVWSLYKDSEESDRRSFVKRYDLGTIIAPYVMIDANREKEREGLYGKGKTHSVKNQKKYESSVETGGDVLGEETAKARKKVKAIVMMHFSAMQVDGEVYVTFAVEGASALFTIALSALLSSPDEEASKHIHALEMRAPVVNRVHYSNGEEKGVWMTCDTRPEVLGDKGDQCGLRMAKWNRQQRRWEEDAKANKLIEKQASVQSHGTQEMSESLLLYHPLTLYPKQEFERTTLVQDTVSPNGLIRGGLSSFKKSGPSRGNAELNGVTNERRTGKKLKAREVMLQRIEQALGGEEQ
ncbi:hypothetical protein CBS101457_006695 [Exobasidium rhododendri]|nr:hypothetical protein CBS101457_006695 [Exobasidium rhododendri]